MSCRRLAPVPARIDSSDKKFSTYCSVGTFDHSFDFFEFKISTMLSVTELTLSIKNNRCCDF